MLGLQSIVASRAKPGNADVSDGNPALQFVMTSAMHPVGKPDGCGAGGGFHTGETCRVVDNIIWQQYLLTTAGLHVARGGVIDATEH